MDKPKSLLNRIESERQKADKRFEDAVIEGGHTAERQHTSIALVLELHFKDGRESEMCPWSLFSGARLRRRDEWDELFILFSNRAVRVEGRNLHLLTAAIKEGKLKDITEHDSAQLALLLKDYETLEEKESIIREITVAPEMEKLVEALLGSE